jgi:hypothetical protein
MLITISGMVGSGKSTTAELIGELLGGRGLQPRYLRFRYLKLFGFDRKPTTSSTRGPDHADTTRRAAGFALRRLTAARTVGYAARIVAFRFSGIGSGSRCDVLDRYFYDNFSHYELTTRRERLYARLLRPLIPVPDLAILLVASDRTIAARRRNYAEEYVVAAGRRYQELPELFPNLVRVSTDPGNSAEEDVRRALQIAIGRARPSSREVS